MKKTKRLEDIQARFQLAIAERGMYEVWSRYYKALSEVVNAILSEYGNKRANRYSFRLCNGEYRLVVLLPHEAL